MNDEVINYFPNIQTNTISPSTEKGVINFLGNVKFSGPIDIIHDSGYNTKKEYTIDFRPLENNPILNIKIKFDKQILVCYNNKFRITKSATLNFPEGFIDKFTLNVKEDNNINIYIKK